MTWFFVSEPNTCPWCRHYVGCRDRQGLAAAVRDFNTVREMETKDNKGKARGGYLVITKCWNFIKSPTNHTERTRDY